MIDVFIPHLHNEVCMSPEQDLQGVLEPPLHPHSAEHTQQVM